MLTSIFGRAAALSSRLHAVGQGLNCVWSTNVGIDMDPTSFEIFKSSLWRAMFSVVPFAGRFLCETVGQRGFAHVKFRVHHCQLVLRFVQQRGPNREKHRIHSRPGSDFDSSAVQAAGLRGHFNEKEPVLPGESSCVSDFEAVPCASLTLQSMIKWAGRRRRQVTRQAVPTGGWVARQRSCLRGRQLGAGVASLVDDADDEAWNGRLNSGLHNRNVDRSDLCPSFFVVLLEHEH
mmetsp:Transcript_17963/g.26343  ORF Transcript_17963/g.26343 Transcript_17963/m.26343 type:complete len:234 (-) Transcript_17963:905-1606(-)